MTLLEIKEEDLLNSAIFYKQETYISTMSEELDTNLYLD